MRLEHDGTYGPSNRSLAAWPLLSVAPMRFFLAALALVGTLRALPAGAACAPVSTAAGLCSSVQGNTCFISSKQCPVVDGSTLDFGAMNVVLRQGSTLNVGAGSMTIKAGGLELLPGTALLGAGGSIIVETVGDIAVLRPSQGASARIDVAHPTAADRIRLESTAGAVRIDGILDARGTYPEGLGGSIEIIGANVLVSGDVRTDGGLLGSGGPVSIDSKVGAIVISGNILGFGGSGGPVDITADGAVSMTATGRIDIRATAPAGDGGLLDIFTISGSIALDGRLFLQGDAGATLEGGGNGGELNVFSAGTLTVTAQIDITGTAPDGQGGDVFMMSRLDLVQTGLIQLQGKGAESDGGTIEFLGEQAMRLGPIDVHGGANLPDSGGAVQATAWCDLTVPSDVTMVAEGDKGSIRLGAGGQMRVTGMLKAGTSVVLEYRTLVPITEGGTFLPELELEQNFDLTPCGGNIPSACGDGSDPPDEGEECDDGNRLSCDGCSSLCKLETCGNDRIDCVGLDPDDQPIFEICDDGNETSGDSCHADCSRLDNFCGDSIVDSAETCDDGNATACDGCSSACQTESCGNGTVECLEECDPPNVGGCSADCLEFSPATCGDGSDPPDPGEECDDGNVDDGDGCSHQCRFEVCGNGTVDAGEECDDFNVLGCDLCSPTCKLEVCGNGIRDCGEECDDGSGNGAPGGSCLPDVCRVGPTCSTAQDTDCIPCADASDCMTPNVCDPATCVDGVCTTLPLTCDDGDQCTSDDCNPSTGCVHAPVSCSDNDACTADSCTQAQGCAHTPISCDDHDDCTTDSCDTTTGCSHVDFAGYELARCRVAAARAVVTGAADADIAAPIRKKLLAKLGGVDARIVAASQAGGNVKKVKKSIKAARRQLQATIRLVTKQRGKKITAATADAILAALDPLGPLLTPPA